MDHYTYTPTQSLKHQLLFEKVTLADLTQWVLVLML